MTVKDALDFFLGDKCDGTCSECPQYAFCHQEIPELTEVSNA